MFVCISGHQGSGKSTLSRLIHERLNFTRISISQLMRDMAAERGISITEMNQLSEADPQFDHEIDAQTIKAAQTQAGRNIIFDSRMAWHFVPDSLKIFVRVDDTVGASRIYNDSRGSIDTYTTVDLALEQTLSRRASERLRYQKFYGVDYLDMSNYDLVLDSTHLSPDELYLAVLDVLSPILAKSV